jgi:hypothetical protein
MTMIETAAPVENPKKIRSAGRDFVRTDLAPPVGAPGRFVLFVAFLVWPFESVSFDVVSSAEDSLTSLLS